jgi:hypothetical protein
VPVPDTSFPDPSVPPGTYDYYVSALYYFSESFATGPATVTITATGKVKGDVYDALTLEPLAGATITLQPGGYTTVTADDGQYTLEDVPWGTYSMVVTLAGYNPSWLYPEVSSITQIASVPLYPSDIMLPLPFNESWDDGSFNTQYWWFASGLGNWRITPILGHEAPAAEFFWSPVLTDYSYALVSPYLDARDVTEHVALEFDLFLSTYNSTGQEHLLVDVWNGSGWVTVADIVNDGDIYWNHYFYDITPYVSGEITQIRFTAQGSGSIYINSWDIDNIAVQERPGATLDGTVTDVFTGNPVEGATVSIPGNEPVYTGTDGFYSINLMEGAYKITYSAEGYLTLKDEGVTVTGTTHYDAALEPEACNAPQDLTYEIIEGDLYLYWNPPDVPSTDEWIHYDNGENYDELSLTDELSFIVAVRFTPDQLSVYRNALLTEVRFFIGENTSTTSFVLKVWEGDNASTLIVNQPLIGIVNGDWNTVVLNTPVPVDDTRELWIGYGCYYKPIYDTPAGVDAGPAVAGYGDLISFDGTTWETLSDYGYSYNWNLLGHIQVPDGQEDNLRSLLGYNIYRDGIQLNANPVTQTQYSEEVPGIGLYTYCVSSVWTLCESESICAEVLITGMSELPDESVLVYPVPAGDFINVEATESICDCKIFNYTGQLIYEQKVEGEKTFRINTSGFRSGSYLVEFISDKGNVVTRKVVIVN